MGKLTLNIRRCAAAATSLGPEDTTRFLELHDRFMAAGMSSDEAAKRAATDLSAELRDEAKDLSKTISALIPEEAPTPGPIAKVVEAAAKAVDKVTAPTTKYAPDYDERLQGISDRLIAKPTPLRKKLNDFVMGFRTQFIDSYDALEQVAARIGDRLKAEQMLYWLRFYKQTNNLMSEAALKGTPVITARARKDGRSEYTVDVKKGASLQDVLTDLTKAGVGSLDAADAQFKTYLIAERALGDNGTGYQSVVGFLPEGKGGKAAVSEDDLQHVLDMGRKNGAFQAARKTYRDYSNGLIDFNVAAGSMSAKVGELLKSQGDYVSFYRQDGDSLNLVVNGERIGTIGNIKSQPYLKELAGGDSQITGFMEGAMRNTHLLMDMAMRNLSTKNTAETLHEMGLAVIGTGDGPGSNTTIRFKSKGVDKYAVIDTDQIGVPSELVSLGMGGIATQLPVAFRILGVPARLLRHFIVRNPVYAARQLFRDSMVNSLLVGVDGVPVLGPLKEVVKAMAGRSTAESDLQSKGIIGGLVFTGDIEDRTNIIKQMTAGTWSVDRGLAALDYVAMQADAGARIQAYNSALKNGLSEMEARMAALETMNFQRRGVSPTMHALGTMIPFMNAQIQGLDVLQRALRGKMPFADRLQIKQKLVTRGLMMAGATLAYAAMLQDDDDYLNASPSERYNNWFIPVPGSDHSLRIPIPFEAGILFKALPEAMYNVMAADHDTRGVMEAFGKMAANALPGGIPQGIKPLIENALNRDFYSGREIEDARMQGLKIGERYADRTTEVSKALGGSFELAGREIGVSPARIDHLVRGYTGSLGMAILSLADNLVGSTTERPTKKLNETPIVGSLFVEKDAAGAITAAYGQIENFTRAKATFDKLVAEGRIEEAVKFAEKFGDQIAKSAAASQFKTFLGNLTKLEQQIRVSPMTGDEKRDALDALRKDKIQYSRMVQEALR